MKLEEYKDALQAGTILDTYEITSLLGRGSFGITYLAKDCYLKQKIAIKEYFPIGFATRAEGGDIQPYSGKHDELFYYGLRSFLKEAMRIVRFKHPQIVRVLRFFRANNTGYIVMEYEEGCDLNEYLNHNPRLSEKEISFIFSSLIDGLHVMHEAGYIHRDIKPANIYIRENGLPVLLDFGSARDIFNTKLDQLTRIYTKNYAPYEQDNTSWEKQGTWTDIFSLGVTLYFTITKELPPNSAQRAGMLLSGNPNQADPYQPLVKRPEFQDKYSNHFLTAIDRALAFHPKNRPNDVNLWKKELFDSNQGENNDIHHNKTTQELIEKKSSKINKINLVFLYTLPLFVLLFISIYILSINASDPNKINASHIDSLEKPVKESESQQQDIALQQQVKLKKQTEERKLQYQEKIKEIKSLITLLEEKLPESLDSLEQEKEKLIKSCQYDINKLDEIWLKINNKYRQAIEKNEFPITFKNRKYTKKQLEEQMFIIFKGCYIQRVTLAEKNILHKEILTLQNEFNKYKKSFTEKIKDSHSVEQISTMDMQNLLDAGKSIQQRNNALFKSITVQEKEEISKEDLKMRFKEHLSSTQKF